MRIAPLSCLLLAAAACSSPVAPDAPADSPPAHAATVPGPQLEVSLFAPVEGLLCIPLPLRFVVRNAGSQPAADAHVHCDLAEGLLTDDGRTAIDFDVGVLPAGASAEMLASAHASRTGRFDLQAMVSAADGAPGGSGSASIFVGLPVLALSITAPAQQVVGQDIAYVLELTNTGDGTALEVVVNHQLPHGMSVVSASVGARISGNSVQFFPGKLAAKATLRFELTARGAAAGKLRSNATAKAACATVAGATAETEIRPEAGHSPR